MYYVVVSNTYQDFNHNFLLLGSQLQRRCFELYFKIPTSLRLCTISLPSRSGYVRCFRPIFDVITDFESGRITLFLSIEAYNP